MVDQWNPGDGSLFDNIDAAVKAIGLRAPGIVWGIATTQWQTPQQRDEFLNLLRQGGMNAG